MSTQLFADIIIPLPLKADFTYRVPDRFLDEIAVGKRVIVQFGKKKFYSGVVRKLHHEEPKGFEIKEIESILDESPVVHPKQFELWTWMANYYMCSEGEVMKAALPSGLKLESQTKVIFNPDFAAQQQLPAQEEIIFRLLSDKKIATIQEVNNAFDTKNAITPIKSLLNKGAISIEEKLSEGYKPKKEKMISLAPKIQMEKHVQIILDSLKRAKKQQEVLLEYLHLSRYFTNESQPIIEKSRLMERIPGAGSAIKSLIDKAIFVQTEQKVNRLSHGNDQVLPSKSLNEAQQKAYKEIKLSFNTFQTTLLHGVTSSGKTEIYIRLIEEYIERGQQVLYLLPEIALTSQIIQRLKNVFGDKVGIYHSKFNDQERVEIWNRVLQFEDATSDSYQVVLGARSALFLPFSKLGLIIIDEEHETSYKQFDPAPRYSARDAAIVLGHLYKAKTLLGTATPAVDTYFNAKMKKYGLVELTQRYQDIELPEVIVADMKKAYKQRTMKSHFTPELFTGIQTALENNEQVILFQNRRGFAPFLQCKSCGWIPKCRHCDVSLTYHKYTNSLNCHYCGYKQNLPQRCEYCGSEEISTKGFGTEKIQEETEILFPDAKVARMDLDTTRAKNAYEKIITSFEQGKINILIGTQMITKGLDFENVSTVGILNADNMLNFPDFRSFERSYQLISQVSGRAGRKHKRGKVYLQTTTPEHPVIIDILNNDYYHMFRSQALERRDFKYPPFYRLISLNIKHRDKQKLDQIAEQLAADLRNSFGNRVLGPQYPVINRIQLWYQKLIFIKLEKDYPPSATKQMIQEKIDAIKAKPGFSSVMILPDVDPQ
ncbi:primosomal protein N' [Puteibacter caeruleilacunae]|nr:primosomal protein N' [Puteibacter caeruleilacunae]